MVLAESAPSSSVSPMNSESKQNGGGKISPPVVCDDPQQQQQQPPQPQRPTRYINNSALGGGNISKINNRSNSSSSSTSKNKSLVRSHAVSEETSPPPPDGVTNSVVVVSSTIMNNNKNGKLRQQNSQQSSSIESTPSIDNNVGGEKLVGNEDNELLEFIIDTLNRNAKDRTLILRIESELISFIKDSKRTSHNFPTMTSYQRMLVHRVSGYFHLEHNLDSSTTCVVVTKTKGTRIPETRFREYIEDNISQESNSNPNKTVLKRESGMKKSHDDQSQTNAMSKSRGKSLEERAEDYNRVRRRIFNSDQQQQQQQESTNGGGVYCWSSSTESNTTNDQQQQQQSPHGGQGQGQSQGQGKPIRHMNRRSTAQTTSTLLKVESFETATINRKNKPPVVNKSYSFGGYGATDGSSNVVVGNSNNMGLNRFSKQDSSSSSSGLSPASSGYKSQSFQSSTENTMTTPNSSTSPQNLAVQETGAVLTVEGLTPPTAVASTHGHGSHHAQCVLAAPVQQTSLPHQQQYIFYPASSNSLVTASGLMQGAPLQMHPQPPLQQHHHHHHQQQQQQQHQHNPSQENVVLWAVTDMNHVPPGSILIDPNSGQALKNTDGTMYHFDPTNPPKQVIPPSQPSEVIMYHPHQPPPLHQQPQLINTPTGEMDHMTQWFTHMGIPPHTQHTQIPTSQQWGEEYYVASPPQPQPPHGSNYISTGATPILWDPSKMTSGAMGLNQQYYPVPAHPPPPPPPPPTTTLQPQHYVVAAPQAGGSQQPVVMQYSVPTSSATSAPYMSYMLQPYNPIVAAAAAAAANYNSLVQYGQQPPQPPRPLPHNAVHHASQQPIKLSKDFCYVPTSTTPTPTAAGGNSAACLYNPFYANAVSAAAAAAAAHVQNQHPGGGHRFPGNPPMYQAQFLPRPGYYNYRSSSNNFNKQPRNKNRARNFSSNNDRSSSSSSSQPPHQQQQQPPPQQPPPPPQQQQQQQSSDINS